MHPLTIDLVAFALLAIAWALSDEDDNTPGRAIVAGF